MRYWAPFADSQVRSDVAFARLVVGCAAVAALVILACL
jgi:hypothetical protein